MKQVLCSAMPRRWTIDDMHALAEKHGGVCESKRYRNVDAHLWWRCTEGHRFEQRPYAIIHGGWCQRCAGRGTPGDYLKRMRATAKERGGCSLARSYTKAKHRYTWECAKGHCWDQTWDIVKGGAWCPRCAGRGTPKERLGDMRELAKARGGRCLSKTFVNGSTPVRMRCREGHEWETKPTYLLAGSWCHVCAGNQPLTREALAEVAKAKGGTLLSKVVTPGKKSRWRCAKGHRWEAQGSAVKGGRWCPTCAKGLRTTLAEWQALAKERGGECLTKRYTGATKLMRWRCAEGHEWRAAGTQLKNSGTWCPHCSRVAPLTLAQMRAHAKERGGRCLSRRYVNAQTPMRWRCAASHTWEASATQVRRGSWCPYCTRKGIHGIEDFLLADFHRVAEERGGRCLSKRYSNVRSRLRFECQLGHRWSASAGGVFLGTWCPECSHTKKPKLAVFQKLAKERGGRCLSEEYVNTTTPLRFECRAGHVWDTRPPNVRKGGWCPECREAREDAVDAADVAEAVRAFGGACLSEGSLGTTTLAEWRCREGHEWRASPKSIYRGSWCPECTGRKRLTLDDLVASASNRDGLCLEDEYLGFKSRHAWQCREGHTWQASVQVIRNGSWCPVCYEPQPERGIARMSHLARALGGHCLSAQYHDPNKPLRWRCADGHDWRAREETVMSGLWCPRCPKPNSRAYRKTVTPFRAT